MRPDEAQMELEERERFWEEVLFDYECCNPDKFVLWYLAMEQDIKDGLIDLEGKKWT